MNGLSSINRVTFGPNDKTRVKKILKMRTIFQHFKMRFVRGDSSKSAKFFVLDIVPEKFAWPGVLH